MNRSIQVEKCDLIQVISKIKIHILNLILNDRATIQVLCYDDDEKMLNGYVFELVGEQYKMWHDDNYIYQFVCKKYGFVLKNNLS